MIFSVAARSWDLCPVNGNRHAPYYMRPNIPANCGWYRRDGMFSLIYLKLYGKHEVVVEKRHDALMLLAFSSSQPKVVKR